MSRIGGSELKGLQEFLVGITYLTILSGFAAFVMNLSRILR